MDSQGMAGDANEERPSETSGGGVSDALRAAVEKTFAAVAEPRGRAQDLLDDLTRRGQETREDLGRRGLEAREASAQAAAKLAEAVDRLRSSNRDDLKRLEERIEALEETVKRLVNRENESEDKPEVEG
jgi:polyhydroxyalkanoate synthesis regulator phasin